MPKYYTRVYTLYSWEYTTTKGIDNVQNNIITRIRYYTE